MLRNDGPPASRGNETACPGPDVQMPNLVRPRDGTLGGGVDDTHIPVEFYFARIDVRKSTIKPFAGLRQLNASILKWIAQSSRLQLCLYVSHVACLYKIPAAVSERHSHFIVLALRECCSTAFRPVTRTETTDEDHDRRRHPGRASGPRRRSGASRDDHQSRGRPQGGHPSDHLHAVPRPGRLASRRVERLARRQRLPPRPWRRRRGRCRASRLRGGRRDRLGAANAAARRWRSTGRPHRSTPDRSRSAGPATAPTGMPRTIRLPAPISTMTASAIPVRKTPD